MEVHPKLEILPLIWGMAIKIRTQRPGREGPGLLGWIATKTLEWSQSDTLAQLLVSSHPAVTQLVRLQCQQETWIE